MTAYRTVSETDDVHIIEGLGIPFGGPFGGRDSYGTFASARTDFHWDLFPDRSPMVALRDADGDQIGEARFIRPVTYHHGFDDTIGLQRHGGWSPVRQDEDGVWVQAQLDKRAKHYAKVRALLDQDALRFSIGSAEHSVRFDDRTGEWLEWPAYELALTPTESNPYAIIATRSAETIRIIEAARADMTHDDAPDDNKVHIGLSADVKSKFLSDMKNDPPVHLAAAMRRLCQWAASGAFPRGLNYDDLRWMYSQYAEELHRRDPKSDAGGDFPAEGSGSRSADSPAVRCASLTNALGSVAAAHDAAAKGGRSAVRAGKRNSGSDQQHLDAAHVAAHDAVNHTYQAGAACDMCDANDGDADDNPNAEPEDDSAARSSEAPTTLRIVEREPDLDAVRASLLDRAATVGEAKVRELIGA